MPVFWVSRTESLACRFVLQYLVLSYIVAAFIKTSPSAGNKIAVIDATDKLTESVFEFFNTHVFGLKVDVKQS